MEDLLKSLREYDALRDDGDASDQVLVRSLRNTSPAFGSPGIMDSLPHFLQESLKKDGINRLFEHQVEAIKRCLDGENIVLESPTASGKTLCFNIPLVLRLLSEPDARGMMIHPMKALSNDQRRQFMQLISELPKNRDGKIESWLYDGDTEEQYRRLIRQSPPSVLLTNPEMLNMSFLGWSDQWIHFLKSLRFLIVDEIHEYRGYFGTNFALLMRRFLMKLNELGSHPQLVLASATCANPLEHARRLTGRDFMLVRETANMRPHRHFAFINPRIPRYRFHDIYLLRIIRAALACLGKNLSTLVFCPSRRFCEEATRKARRDADTFGLDPQLIVPYRAGFRPEERREIEEGMRSGKYKVIFTTNALEIGIDVGSLDACVLAGFPENVMSAWQRLGRTGRNWEKTAYILFYAMNNPFDQFFAENIDAFLEKPFDEIIIGLDNEELIKRHIPYLLYEMHRKVEESDCALLGEALWERAKKAKIPIRKPNYQRLDIRGASGPIYQLICQGREVGTISEVHRFREAYVGAIYNHCGKMYRVKSHGGQDIDLEHAEPHIRTDPSFWTTTQSSDLIRGVRYRESIAACYGKLTIFENFAGYKVVDERTEAILEEVSAQLGMRRDVRGFWISIEDLELFHHIDYLKGLIAVEQFLRIGAPFVIPCDRYDIGTLAERDEIYFHETVPGGIGIAEKMLDVWRSVLEKGIQIAEKCTCDDGCPRCIHPPRFYRDVRDLSKTAGFELAIALLDKTGKAPEEIYDPETYTWKSVND